MMGLRIFRAVRVGELTHYMPYLAAIVFLFVHLSRVENLKLLKGSGRFSIRRFWVVSPIISLTPLNHNNNKKICQADESTCTESSAKKRPRTQL